MNHSANIVGYMLASSMTLVAGRAMTSPLLALFVARQLGASAQDVGLLIGMATLTGTLCGLYGGYVVDRLDKRRLLLVALLSVSAGFLLLTFAHDLYIATLSLVLVESAAALFLITSKVLISEYVPSGRRARVFSLRYILVNISYAVGPMIGVVLAGVHAKLPFQVAGALSLLSIVLVMAMPGRKLCSAGAGTGFSSTLRALKNDRVLVVFTLAGLFSAVIHGRFPVYLSQSLLARQPSDQAMQALSAVLACNALTVIVGQYPIGRLLTPQRLPLMLAAGSLMFIIGLYGFIQATTLQGWCVAMLLFTAGEMLVLPAEYLFIDRIAPEQLRGSYYGAQNLAALGGALGPILGGYFLASSHPDGLFVMLMVIAALAGLLYAQAGRLRTAG